VFIIFMGVSGSGKTTIGTQVAARWGVPYYEGDAYHPPENVLKMAQGIPLTDVDRVEWLNALSQLIGEKLAAGESGVLSCSALKEDYRKRLQVDPDQVHFIFLDGSYELIQKRMEARQDHYMPTALLRSQFDTLERPEDVFPIEIDQPVEEILREASSYLQRIGFSSG